MTVLNYTISDALPGMIYAGAKMKKDKKTFLGKICWTSAAACAREIKMHRNTVEDWVKKTRIGAMDMPIMGASKKGSHAMIPVDDFLAWYGYVGQN